MKQGMPKGDGGQNALDKQYFGCLITLEGGRQIVILEIAAKQYLGRLIMIGGWGVEFFIYDSCMQSNVLDA